MIILNEENPLPSHSIPEWKRILRNNFTRWEKLADFLELTETQRNHILKKSHFPLNLPLRLAEKIHKGTLEDPLLKQFLPLMQETMQSTGFEKDPVGDQASRCGSKLLHKYEGRVLLVTTGACAMHCRYCFRQNFDYDTQNKLFEAELEAIAADDSIQEVILSGGDPLSLSDALLHTLLQRLSFIPHVKRIRFHTRFPIGIPERITRELLEALAQSRCAIWFVLHINHPRELDQEILAKISLIQKMGIIVMNQSVLLKGVNDDAKTLIELSEKLINHAIVPYYLHQLDRVQGASHFEVQEKEGKALIQAMAAALPGYGVPKYVRETAGEPNKTAL